MTLESKTGRSGGSAPALENVAAKRPPEDTATEFLKQARAAAERLDRLRDEIAATAAAAGIHAEIIERYCALRDDAGTAYQVENLAGCARALAVLIDEILNAERAAHEVSH